MIEITIVFMLLLIMVIHNTINDGDGVHDKGLIGYRKDFTHF